MNKHKIAWIALAVGIVVVLMLTWLVGVSPRLTHIKEADAQTAQIEESNKKTYGERDDRPAEGSFASAAAPDS